MGTQKKQQFINTAFALLVAAFIINGCNPSNTVSPIDDLIDQFPGMTLIRGAENVEITVNRNNSTAFYNINLAGLDAEAISLAGDYKAWCTQWDISIGSNNAVYEAAKVYDIAGEGYWKNVVYLVNKADDYLAADSTLQWTELQVAVWAMINHKKIELTPDFVTRLDNEFRDVRIDVIQQVIADVDVKINGWDFTQIDNSILYVEISDDVQDLVIVRPKD
ncbi:MAG: hypothetical protein LC662_04130 [Rhodothermaceae bacterium]|nr:hypothetical protein [Rhodothermaceae bacterium]